jgi:hypothetical protein
MGDGSGVVGGKEGRNGMRCSREPEWSWPMLGVVPECRECITWRRLQVRAAALQRALRALRSRPRFLLNHHPFPRPVPPLVNCM